MSGPALDAQLSLRVGRGEESFLVEAELALESGVLVLFGPSGAGKSLTLQALAGLVSPQRGWIRVNGDVLLDRERHIDVPAHRRRIGYVPQQQSLLPFCDVAANVAFGLPRQERRPGNPRVQALLEEFRLSDLARARPDSLSGGERQRVALARALAVEPRLLLLDEPFASIDHAARAKLHQVLKATLDHHGTPAVFVTHDPEEAATLGDTVACFERGRTIATGSPAALLPGGQTVLVRGTSAEMVGRVSNGRVQIRIQSAVVEGPASLLNESQGRELELELRVRSSEAARKRSPDEEAE